MCVHALAHSYPNSDTYSFALVLKNQVQYGSKLYNDLCM